MTTKKVQSATADEGFRTDDGTTLVPYELTFEDGSEGKAYLKSDQPALQAGEQLEKNEKGNWRRPRQQRSGGGGGRPPSYRDTEQGFKADRRFEAMRSAEIRAHEMVRDGINGGYITVENGEQLVRTVDYWTGHFYRQMLDALEDSDAPPTQQRVAA